ncbi:MAG: class I SAM-dependent methyltransferase [Mycobacterium sp.]|uniref:class I SAM-dependent methyltransferase n=1 Tax=Mycobacterium sp. TaxID=1785 RepID=UPI001EBFB309|nr:class I SAM-dependent methyltransferase [Mycobacterium sp.]MBW0019644.1 class I SAM-dependent methyltransferase [Mycobacterium sp.]
MRTDDDTWDPATGVGMTATFGAAARAVGTNKGLLDDPYAEPLVRAAGLEYFNRIVTDEVFADDDGEDQLVTGMLEILATYAQFVDQFLADAGRAGIRQVVILGSGLDARPFRLWWPAGTTVYEIDQPNVIDFKCRVLHELDAKLTANRCAVGIDLRQDWLAALRRVGFDAAEPTAWVAENLLIGYLPPDGQDRLLDTVTAVSAAGSRFVADHMPTWTTQQLRAGEAFVERWREFGLEIDLAGLTYPGDYRDVPEYLAAHGWHAVDRNVVELFTTTGSPSRYWVSGRDVAVTPRYVTATRV